MKVRTGWMSGQRARTLLIGLVMVAVAGSLAGQWQQQRDWQQQFVRQQAEQRAAQAKQSRGVCEALVGLDGARIGAIFAPASRTGVPLSKSYGYRLANHIHAVVQATHCPQLLAGKEKP